MARAKAKTKKAAAKKSARGGRKKRGMDPVTLAVLSKRFESITTKMSNTLLRTGRSGVLNLAKDFSTSIVTRGCELLAGAETLPASVP